MNEYFSKRIGDLNKGEESVSEIYLGVVSVMSKAFGIKKEEFPRLVFKDTGTLPDGVNDSRASYNRRSNQVMLRKDMKMGDIAESLGEELGHYVRHKLTDNIGGETKNTEKLTNEFFGFLGRRIAYEGLKEKGLSELFPKGPPTYESRGRVVEFLRGLRETIRRPYDLAENSGETTKELLKKSGEARRKRKDILQHARGYDFAQEVNLEGLDLRELYSLPQEEVRMRFFRQDQRRSGLEKAVAASILIGIPLFFITKTITGKVIVEGTVNNSLMNFGVFFLLTAGVLLSYRILKKP